MTLTEFEKYMEDEFGAYWTAFYQIDRNTRQYVGDDLTRERYPYEIVQLDSIGLSIGNESLMIDMEVWVEEIKNPIKVHVKMLGSNRNKCFYAMREIMDKIKVSYYSVNSNP